ncbi:uncharacterized protein LOC108744470 isoform X1 [Agrilus planipennis]|uniref:Uncharacterized protein LOC108744470 isoform X1 n=1 Tax=Agrilus planipennis TaxID=224129 RepID=A0A7F5RKQ5_AGRPL|nr:uncharacterized protein LOC108744470 isoform X1 [Agrilus planipennis]
MAASGVGRGRGWLNLNKRSNPIRPGPIPSSNENQNAEKASLGKDKVLSTLEALDVKDDGILLNQKLKYILECFEQECKTANEVEDKFKLLYQKCLQDSKLATKLVLMVSSYSFITTEVHSVKLRNIFIRHIQQDFENSKQLQTTDSDCFRNAIRMLGEFFNKARLVDGSQIKFLAAPLLRYFDMLVESAQPEDLELFTVQLFLNGSSIKAEFPQKLSEIMVKIRVLLTTDTQLTKISKLWLLLALDVESHRFSLLTSDLQKFYQDQLGDKAMAGFQGFHNPLSVEISYSNKTLDSYQSSVNVLQVSPPESTSPLSDNCSSAQNSSSTSSQVDLDLALAINNTKNFMADSSNNDWSGANKDSSGSSNIGRPILGVGARLLKGKDSSQWENGDKGWNNRQKSGANKSWGGQRKGQIPSKSKGWEHDDRFETVYQ